MEKQYSKRMRVLQRSAAAALFLALILSSCSDSGGALEAPLALFHELKYGEALPLFERAAVQNPRDADTRTWLAETYRRLERMEEAESAARAALAIDSCSSFAHHVLASILLPSPNLADIPDTDPSWQHLMHAIECDSANGNAWMMIMVGAIWREKEQLAQRAQRRLGESGFLTPAALAFGRWLLETIPENAILFTNGDMDTYPTMALQVTENLRPDVTIIEREWLNFPWGRRWYREHENIPIPLSEQKLAAGITEPALEILHAWAAQIQSGSFPRSVTFAITVRESFYSTLMDRLQYAGSFYQLHPEPVTQPNDLDALKASLVGVQPDDFTGPWVSKWDISPIRSMYTRYLSINMTESALVYVEALVTSGRFQEAEMWLTWADEFEKGTELGSYHTERIQELRVLVAAR
ncbi:tetratricopeptide repeat protein [Candidatus Neomarinimicrobiota bacterium]